MELRVGGVGFGEGFAFPAAKVHLDKLLHGLNLQVPAFHYRGGGLLAAAQRRAHDGVDVGIRQGLGGCECLFLAQFGKLRVRASGILLGSRHGGLPVAQQDKTRHGAGLEAPIGGLPGIGWGLHRCSAWRRLPRLPTTHIEDASGLAFRGGVHGDVGEFIGHRVLGAWNPLEGVAANLVEQAASLKGEFLHVGVLDFPAPVHLFHHEFGVHIELHLVRAQFHGGFKATEEPMVFGHVVGGFLAYDVSDFLQQLRAVFVVDRGTGAGNAGVAARAAISEDDEFHDAGRTR